MLAAPVRKLILLIGTFILIVTLITVTVINLAPSKEKVDLAVEAVKAQKSETAKNLKPAIAEVEENKMIENKEERKTPPNASVNKSSGNTVNNTTANNNTTTPTPKITSPSPAPPASASCKMREPPKDTLKPVSNKKPDSTLSKTAPATVETDKKAPLVKATENALTTPIPLNKVPDVFTQNSLTNSDILQDTPKDPLINPDVLPLGTTTEASTTDSTVSETVNPPSNVKNLKIQEIQTVPCGFKKKFACYSFVISGFPDDHIVKIFLANKISLQPEIFVKAHNEIEDKNDFVAEDLIENLGEAVEEDGVRIQRTKLDLDKNIAGSFKTSTFVQLFNPISHKIKDDTSFYIVVSGPADKVKAYDLGQEMKVKVKGSLISQNDNRVSGFFEISGFDDGEKVIKVFMSLIKKDEQKYYDINNELLKIDEDNIEEEVTKLLRKESKITEHSIGDIIFKHTKLKSGFFSFSKSSEQQEFEKFKSFGNFTEYFKDLLSRKSSMSGTNFFVILIGKEADLEHFKLAEEQKV